MRGNPHVRVVIAVAVFVVFGVLIWVLTKPRNAAGSPAPVIATENQGQRVTLTVSFEYEMVPEKISLKLLKADKGEEMIVTPIPGKPSFAAWSIDLESSVDMLVSATWADANAHALRVIVSGAEVQPGDRTLWLDKNSKSDVMSITRIK